MSVISKNLQEVLFLDATNLLLGKLSDNRYLEVYKTLTEVEKTELHPKFSKEIHEIYSGIVLKPVKGAFEPVSNVEEYKGKYGISDEVYDLIYDLDFKSEYGVRESKVQDLLKKLKSK